MLESGARNLPADHLGNSGNDEHGFDAWK